MMHMDKVLTYFSIGCFKITTTYQALVAFLRHTLSASLLVALILVGFHSNQRTLIKLAVIFWIIYVINVFVDHLMGMQQEL